MKSKNRNGVIDKLTKLAAQPVKFSRQTRHRSAEMSLEKKFSKIMDNYTFRGSYQELKKIVQAEIGDGVWNSLGQIKAFVSAKRHRELNWNPETGGILFVANLDRN